MHPKSLVRALLPLLLLSATAKAADITPNAVTDELVSSGLKKGVDFLLNSRNPDGNWEQTTKFWDDHSIEGGETCLCLYALLHVGEMGEDPRLGPRSKELAPTVKYVVNLNPDSVYAASLQGSCLALMPKDMPGVKEAMVRARNFLITCTRPGGGHSYGTVPDKTDHDHSNSNFALLGLAAIADTSTPGVEVPPNYWQAYENFWLKEQNPDGGWGYASTNREKSTLPMTAAGVASLLLCRQFTLTDVTATPKKAAADKALETALAKMNKEYDPRLDNVYYLYTIERIGLASGMKYLKSVDWYRAGAALLLGNQGDSGGFNLSNKDVFYSGAISPNVFTACSLLFLARGRSPLMFNKLEYNGAWDARPRDDANVTTYIAHAVERPLAWQSVTLAPSADWLDAPVLLITGSKDPKFSDTDLAKFKSYVESGGTIFSTADNSANEFTVAMKKYAAKVAGEDRLFRELPKDHPLYNLWSTVTNPPKLQGISNGIRELWIHSPADLGAVWQKNKSKEFKAPFEVAANLSFYVSGKSAPAGHRLDSLAVQPPTEGPSRTINLARIQYSGNWDPEPGAWPRLAKLAAATFKTRVDISNTPLEKLDFTKTPVAHLTGIAAITLDEDARKALAKFVEDGGTLLIDSTGGNKTFADSVKAALAQIFPNQPLEAIPPDHPLYSGETPDTTKIETVVWRKYTRVRDNKVPEDKPNLFAIKKGDRLAVIFSPDDLTSGLLGTNTWGIAGYAPKSAQSLTRNLLLYTTKK